MVGGYTTAKSLPAELTADCCHERSTINYYRRNTPSDTVGMVYQPPAASTITLAKTGDTLTTRVHTHVSDKLLQQVVAFARDEAQWVTSELDIRLTLCAPTVLVTMHGDGDGDNGDDDNDGSSLRATGALGCTDADSFWVGIVVVERRWRRRGASSAMMHLLVRLYQEKR